MCVSNFRADLNITGQKMEERMRHVHMHRFKLDGLGPVDNRPSTDWSNLTLPTSKLSSDGNMGMMVIWDQSIKFSQSNFHYVQKSL